MSLSDRSGTISTALLGQVRAESPEAWERLVQLYGPLVYRWCRRAGVAEHDAGDVLQEVFAGVLRDLPGFRREGPQDSFTAWLATITRNAIRGHFRRRGREAAARGGTDAQLAMAAVAQAEERSAECVRADAPSASLLRRRLLGIIQAEFRETTWRAFLGTAVEGRSAAAVAEELGVSVAAVYMAKSRVLRRVRETLAELEPPRV